jgi:hypothetical protein
LKFGFGKINLEFKKEKNKILSRSLSLLDFGLLADSRPAQQFSPVPSFLGRGPAHFASSRCPSPLQCR